MSIISNQNHFTFAEQIFSVETGTVFFIAPCIPCFVTSRASQNRGW